MASLRTDNEADYPPAKKVRMDDGSGSGCAVPVLETTDARKRRRASLPIDTKRQKFESTSAIDDFNGNALSGVVQLSSDALLCVCDFLLATELCDLASTCHTFHQMISPTQDQHANTSSPTSSSPSSEISQHSFCRLLWISKYSQYWPFFPFRPEILEKEFPSPFTDFQSYKYLQQFSMEKPMNNSDSSSASSLLSSVSFSPTSSLPSVFLQRACLKRDQSLKRNKYGTIILDMGSNACTVGFAGKKEFEFTFPTAMINDSIIGDSMRREKYYYDLPFEIQEQLNPTLINSHPPLQSHALLINAANASAIPANSDTAASAPSRAPLPASSFTSIRFASASINLASTTVPAQGAALANSDLKMDDSSNSLQSPDSTQSKSMSKISSSASSTLPSPAASTTLSSTSTSASSVSSLSIASSSRTFASSGSVSASAVASAAGSSVPSSASKLPGGELSGSMPMSSNSFSSVPSASTAVPLPQNLSPIAPPPATTSSNSVQSFRDDLQNVLLPVLAANENRAWESTEAIFVYALRRLPAAALDGNTVLIADKLIDTGQLARQDMAARRQVIAAIIFRRFPTIHRLAFCNESYLSLLSSGRTSGILLHVGFARSTCAVFLNGRLQNLLCLPSRVVGGQLHSRMLMTSIFSRGGGYRPTISDMFFHVPVLKRFCYVAMNPDEELKKSKEEISVLVPVEKDKNNVESIVTLQHERFTSAEVFFFFGFPLMVMETFSKSTSWPIVQCWKTKSSWTVDALNRHVIYDIFQHELPHAPNAHIQPHTGLRTQKPASALPASTPAPTPTQSSTISNAAVASSAASSSSISASPLDASSMAISVPSVSPIERSIYHFLLSNVILSGKSSTLPGFQRRFYNELAQLLRTSLAVLPDAELSSAALIQSLKVEISPADATWLGGSILASLEQFDDLVFTRKEFEQNPSETILKHMEV